MEADQTNWLAEGQRVRMQIGQGQKGPEARSIESIAKNAEIGGGGVRLLIPTELTPVW
jgi:hypothetical protein